MAAQGGTKAVVTALLANGGLAIAKFAAFLITRSSSMLAESVHSVADTTNQALLLFGLKVGNKEEDDEHQFGYGRERYFWSFVVALVLFVLGSAYAIWEGIHKIRDPHEIEWVGIALGVLVLGMFLEGFAFRTAIKEARPLKGDRTWWQFIRTGRIPELTVVILEDLGAVIGLLIAFTALSAAEIFDAPIFDGIGTLSIGILLGVIAVILVIEMRSMLIGEGAGPDEMSKIRKVIGQGENVKQLIHVRTNYNGPDQMLIAAKVEFADDLSIAELARSIDSLEDTLREELPHAEPIYLEPDIQKFKSVFTKSDDQDSTT